MPNRVTRIKRVMIIIDKMENRLPEKNESPAHPYDDTVIKGSVYKDKPTRPTIARITPTNNLSPGSSLLVMPLRKS